MIITIQHMRELKVNWRMDIVGSNSQHTLGFTVEVKIGSDTGGVGEVCCYETLTNEIHECVDAEIIRALSQWHRLRERGMHRGTWRTGVYIMGRLKGDYYTLQLHVQCTASTCEGDIYAQNESFLVRPYNVELHKASHKSWCKRVLLGTCRISKGGLVPEELCAICLERLQESSMRLPSCGHVFCEACIADWMLTHENNTCPKCRCELM